MNEQITCKNSYFVKQKYMLLCLLISFLAFPTCLLYAEDTPSLDQGIKNLAADLEKQVEVKIESGIIRPDTRTAVMDILEANTNKRLELSNYVESGLTNEMVQFSKLNILDREKTLKVRDVIEKPIRELAGTPLIPKGVDFKYVVTGKFTLLGEDYLISVQLIELKNAEILASAQAKVKTKMIPSKLLGLAGISIAEMELAHIARADAAETKGDWKRAIEILKEFFLKFPNSNRETEVQSRIDDIASSNTEADKKVRAAELLMGQQGMEKQARGYLNSVIKNYTKSPAAITAVGLILVLDFGSEDNTALKKSYDFEVQYPQHPVTLKIKAARNQYQERLKNKEQKGKADVLLAEGLSLYDANKIFESREKFQAIIFHFPSMKEAENAKSMLEKMDKDEAKANEILAAVKILINNPQTYTLAENELLKIKAQYPKTMANVDAMAYLIILNFKNRKDASRESAYFLANFPNHHLAPEVKKEQQSFLKIASPTEPGAEQLNVAKKLLDNKLVDQAIKILSDLKKEYPKSSVGKEATGLLIMTNLQRCKYSESDIVAWVAVNRDSPLSVSILEEQNKALKNCKSEELAPQIEKMVFIKGGEITVGIPKQKIAVDPYYMDVYEVTNDEYNKCVETGRCKKSLYHKKKKFNQVDLPVVGVNWKSANNYCLFVKKRLPGEYEWEWAALGAQNKVDYPDSSILPAIAHFKDNTSYKKPTQKTGIKEPNAIGLFDMVGNVSEWVADWYDLQYYSNIPYQNPKGPGKGSKRVHRGGNWSSAGNLLVPLNRSFDYESKKRNTLGFRCAKSLDSK
jgi:formylglycine-generating enzyme required for sulfatase activity/TolA-binding protein